MPFMGRDWRSPGEAWVKTESLGWQRMKIIESQLYLTACHHDHPACSWPPRNHFGQHMANNCNNAQDIDCDKRIVGGMGNCHSARGSRSSAETSSSDSSDSSGQSSASTSPTGSPEKNNSSRHIHPIAISSPYGCYSASCRDSSPECMSEKTNPSSCDTDDKDGKVTPYNIDLLTHADSGVQSSAPILMKDGVQIDMKNPVDPSGLHSNNAAKRANLVPDEGFLNDRSTSSSPTAVSPPSQDSDPSCHLACGCCCCSSHLSYANSHHHFLKEQQPKTAPHCRISVRTREVAMHNTISEAFYRLDFYNAIHDIRRFNYICKLLHLLITQNLTSLSGCATRVLFTMLEQVAYEVSSNKRDIHIIRNLLEELRLTIQKYYCWGRPIGSSLLWQQHFETIERISQIVKGIELSPPKYDKFKVTLNSLPVEMIREILLRLNDYRDLVNSAQASPVMRLMIDDQCIWQRLCRYHFTEQQLSLALENNDLVKKHTLRGIKYARTTSADGRNSYRKPVTHEQSPSSSKTRQQLEETASQRNPYARRSSNGTGTTSSQVTDAVKIFDKPHGSLGSDSSSSQSSSSRNEQTRHSARGKENQSHLSKPGPSHSSGDGSMNNDKKNPEIDWERVFHQMRKRFDLKEEYADCLLLCRHCRCLFWKSFGHPCIRSDDLRQDNVRHQRHANQSVGSRNGCDNHLRSRESGASSASRPSVASLSRNFDRQAPYGGASGESLDQRAALNANQNLDNGVRVNNQRRPLDVLSAQLRERNANRLQPQQNRHLNGQDDASLSASKRELVPKHVTITPQAFLKFFSL